MGDSRTSTSSRTLGVGAENDVTISPAPSTVPTGSIPIASSSLSSAAATSVSEQGAGSTTDYPPEELDMSKLSSSHTGVRGDSTLSTSIVPTKASGPSSQADVFSNGGSTESPFQGYAPKNRLAGPGLRYSSAASDYNQVQSSPGASPAATKSQPMSTTGIPNGDSDSPPQDPAGENSANTPVRSSSESPRNPSVIVTTTNAQGSPITYKVRAAVIKVPVTTTNNNGDAVVTESLSTAAATATFNKVITSTNAAGSAVVQTLRIPAVVYTFTNPQGSVATTTSAVVPFNPNHAPSHKSTNLDGRPGNYDGSASPDPASAQSGDNGGEVFDTQHSFEGSSKSNDGEVEQNSQSNPAGENPVQPGSEKEGVPDTQPGSGDSPQSNNGKIPQNDQSNSAAANTVQPGSPNGEASDAQYDSEGRPKSNTGEDERNGQANSAEGNKSADSEGNKKSNSRPTSTPGSPAHTNPLSHHGGSSDSSQFNSSDLGIGSAYDRLANRGLAALAGNASRITDFVYDTISNQTNAQNQALKARLKTDFDSFVDGIFADPSSRQTGSQIGNGYPFPQNLTSQSCSDLEELDEWVLTELFFVEYYLNIIYGHYQDVRNVIIKECR